MAHEAILTTLACCPTLTFLHPLLPLILPLFLRCYTPKSVCENQLPPQSVLHNGINATLKLNYSHTEPEQ